MYPRDPTNVSSTQNTYEKKREKNRNKLMTNLSEKFSK
jgi:hypothetical protein